MASRRDCLTLEWINHAERTTTARSVNARPLLICESFYISGPMRLQLLRISLIEAIVLEYIYHKVNIT